MTLRLYNTLARAKQEFRPLDPEQVRLYVCGPTVYDYAHIGNARPAIVFDVLFRLLRHHYGADHVTYVRNITDVDDKINARALRDHPGLPLNEAIRRVTEPTAKQYRTDVEALGCLPPTHEPRATDFVLPRADGRADMTGLIQSLLDHGNAYVAEGEVLFDTRSMPDYGALSRRPLDEQQAGARVAVDAHKRHPADFVLWKQSSADEPGWDARFTVEDNDVAIRGRPGWHIECSAMSAAYLGEVFDIHGGGLDLIFPHHENEIAQSRCAHGTHAMANLWMHNGFVQVEGRKMSKSEGNFVTIHDLLETEVFGGRRWPGAVLRLAMLSTHYREPIDFSRWKLEDAENSIQRWRRYSSQAAEAEGEIPKGIVRALSDDLDFATFLQRVSSLMKAEYWSANPDPEWLADFGLRDDFLTLSKEDRTAHAVASANRSLELVGITIAEKRVLTGAQEAAIAERLALIRDKNWAEADRIRDTLLAAGIRLKDGKDPASGERVTSWEFLS